MRANIIKDMIDVTELTIGEVLLLKRVLGLTDSEAIEVFLGGVAYENIPA